MTNLFRFGSLATDDRAGIKRVSLIINSGSGVFGLTVFHNNPTTLVYEKYVVPANTDLVPISVNLHAINALKCGLEIGFHTDAAHAGGVPSSGLSNWVGDSVTNGVSSTKRGVILQSTSFSGVSHVNPDSMSARNLLAFPTAPSSVVSGKFIWFAMNIGNVTDHYEVSLTFREIPV